MQWYVAEIADIILTLCYAYLLMRIRRTTDPYFSTPFYLFFFTTGVGGIVSVYSHILASRVIYYPPTAFIYTSLYASCFQSNKKYNVQRQIINHIGAFGSMIGKAIIIMHRYLVFSSNEIVENRWSKTICRILICLQYSIPIATSLYIPFVGYTYQTIDGEQAIYSLSEHGMLMNKAINGSFYAIYSVYSIVLVSLTGRALLRLSKLVEGPTRKVILEQQRNMFIIVIACSLSHLVKAFHQFFWGLSAAFGSAELTNKIWPFYVYANGLATYTAPIFLVIFSRRVLRLLVYVNSDDINSTSSISPSAVQNN